MKNDHYFSNAPISAHNERQISTSLLGFEMRFHTDAGVFSRDEVDPGSRLLVESVGALSGRVLDMGCGWGPVGLSIALKNPECTVLMADVNERAVQLSERNRRTNGVNNAHVIQSDAFESVEGEFDHILTNPPIRAGKAVIYGMFDESFRRLRAGGTLNIVIRKQHGAPSAIKYLQTMFEQVTTLEKDAGYWILEAVKADA